MTRSLEVVHKRQSQFQIIFHREGIVDYHTTYPNVKDSRPKLFWNASDIKPSTNQIRNARYCNAREWKLLQPLCALYQDNVCHRYKATKCEGDEHSSPTRIQRGNEESKRAMVRSLPPCGGTRSICMRLQSGVEHGRSAEAGQGNVLHL